jgi:hypothetical protein
MDDDVMDQQKYASAAMVLAKALVDLKTPVLDSKGNHTIPTMPLHLARQTMTRADFIQSYDHDNLFTIDASGQVRADSVPMMRAFRAVCSQEGFDTILEETLERIGDIESLGRTREVTIKDLWDGGKYRFQVGEGKGRQVIEMTSIEKPDDEKNDDERRN